MDRLNNEQSKFLKKLNVQTIHFQDMSEQEREICLFLKTLNYVHINTVGKSRTFPGVVQFYNDNVSAEITEAGRMYLANEHIDKFKITIPDIIGWILSCIALVISMISLLKP